MVLCCYRGGVGRLIGCCKAAYPPDDLELLLYFLQSRASSGAKNGNEPTTNISDHQCFNDLLNRPEPLTGWMKSFSRPVQDSCLLVFISGSISESRRISPLEVPTFAGRPVFVGGGSRGIPE
jgi:hypothetical protein